MAWVTQLLYGPNSNLSRPTNGAAISTILKMMTVQILDYVSVVSVGTTLLYFVFEDDAAVASIAVGILCTLFSAWNRLAHGATVVVTVQTTVGILFAIISWRRIPKSAFLAKMGRCLLIVSEYDEKCERIRTDLRLGMHFAGGIGQIRCEPAM